MNAPTELQAGKLCVRFEWREDRWQHTIVPAPPSTILSEATNGGLHSIEGASADAWPASPALQSLHIEPRAAGVTVALLVGMSGTSHWSLSVEANATLQAATFDVACRTRDQPAWLGSSYRTGEAGIKPPAPSAINSMTLTQARRYTFLPWLEVTSLEADGPTLMDFNRGAVVFRPLLSDRLQPYTWRWRYRFEARLRRPP